MSEPYRLHFHYCRDSLGDWYWAEGNDVDGPLCLDDVTSQMQRAVQYHRRTLEYGLYPIEISIMHYYPLEPEDLP